MDGKRCKRREQVKKGEESEEEVFFTTRDPFTFNETVQYYHKQFDSDGKKLTAPPTIEEHEYDVLTDFNNVFPLGYPTEQYLCWVKNDVQKAFLRLKEEKK